MTSISRSMLYVGEAADLLRKFEAEKQLSIRNIPLSSLVDHKVARSKQIMQASVGISPSLIQQKVLDLVIRGAEHVPLWNKACRIVEFGDANKIEVPVVGYTDWKTYKGVTGSKGLREAGGHWDTIEMDCSNEKGLRRVSVALRKTWIRDNQWGAVEESIINAGYSMFDEVLSTILSKYETDVDSTMTNTVANWGADHYKALLQALALIAAERMYPDLILINPTEVYDLGILDYFIHADYTGKAGVQDISPISGLFGYLLPNHGIPIYFSPEVTTAYMTVAASKKSVVLGIKQDLTIENFDDVIEGKEGAVLTMQWDVKSGKDASKRKPTAKAWAVVTGA